MATVLELYEQKLLDQVAQIGRRLDGVLGVAAIDLITGRDFSYNGYLTFPAASTIKVPIIVQLYVAVRAGRIRLSDSVQITEADLIPGSPFTASLLQDIEETGLVIIQRLSEAMIQCSDNTATNVLLQLMGMESVNTTMDELNLPSTRVKRLMMDSAAAMHDQENITTPMDMAQLLAELYRGNIVDADASHQILQVMSLPKLHVEMTQVIHSIPPGIRVASKPGWLKGAYCDVAVVYSEQRPFVVSIYGTFLRDGDWGFINDITDVIVTFFTRVGAANMYGRAI